MAPPKCLLEKNTVAAKKAPNKQGSLNFSHVGLVLELGKRLGPPRVSASVTQTHYTVALWRDTGCLHLRGSCIYTMHSFTVFWEDGPLLACGVLPLRTT